MPPVILALRQYPQSGARRTVIADLIRNPEVKGVRGDNKTKQPLTVILALRQYPQGGEDNDGQPSSPSSLTEEDQSLSQCLTRDLCKTNRHSRVGGNL